MHTVPRNTYQPFLDWLRVIAIFALLFFHTGMLFDTWGWHIKNAELMPQIDMAMDIAHRLRMPLLFVIAGAAIFYALQKHSVWAVLKERTVRIFLPLILGMFIIVPPQVYLERLYRNQYNGSYFHFYVDKVLQFEAYPAGNFSWHHLWFIAYLFVYVLLSLPVMAMYLRRAKNKNIGNDVAQASGSAIKSMLWVYLLALPIGLNEAVLKPLFPETHNLTHDWYIFNHYFMLYIFGFVLAATPSIWAKLMQLRYVSTVLVGIVVVAILYLKQTGFIVSENVADGISANIFTWFSLLMFLGWGRRCLNHDSAFLKYAREACYPVYILHQTIIVALGYFLLPYHWDPAAKFFLIVGGTLLGSLFLHHFLIKRFALLRLVFGLKWHKGRKTTGAGSISEERDVVTSGLSEA